MRGALSIRNPLDLIECHRIITAIVEARRPRGLVASHLLGDFELTAVLQVRSDAGYAKAVGM